MRCKDGAAGEASIEFFSERVTCAKSTVCDERDGVRKCSSKTGPPHACVTELMTALRAVVTCKACQFEHKSEWERDGRLSREVYVGFCMRSRVFKNHTI